jgi:hypothetical protein
MGLRDLRGRSRRPSLGGATPRKGGMMPPPAVLPRGVAIKKNEAFRFGRDGNERESLESRGQRQFGKFE